MAKNTGNIKLRGTLNNLTYYKTQDGDLIRTKGGIEKSRIMTDPNFARTRENMNEFATSAHAGKLLRRAVSLLSGSVKDNRVTSRMSQAMSRVIKMDTINLRGSRTVTAGIMGGGDVHLEGFDFNGNALLDRVLKAALAVDNANGEITIADFVPKNGLTAPEGATHVKLQSAFLELDFLMGTYQGSVSPAEELAIDMTEQTVVLTPPAFTPGTGAINNFAVLLVEFYQEVNGAKYPLGSGSSMGIVSAN